METKFIEATNVDTGGINWGKFMVAQFTQEEWNRRSQVGNRPMLDERGWTPEHYLVLDLQTGEGAIFAPHGFAKADLDKHKIWVCPLFEPFLDWFYQQKFERLEDLPSLVKLKAPSAMYGYRREGKKK